MTPHTSSSSSSSSTPTGPLILFLALCLFFQLPAFTKANAQSASTNPTVTLASTPQLQEPQTIPPQAHEQQFKIKTNVGSHNHTDTNDIKLELRAAEPQPQFLTITATGIYSQQSQPQYTPYTSVQPQVIITQYITPVTTTAYYTPLTTTYYTSPQRQHTQTTTTTLPAGFIPVAAGGYYCSTLYAQGPGLPTTRQGDCGNILVESSPVAGAQPSSNNAGVLSGKMVGLREAGSGKSMLAMVLVLAVGVAGLG